MGDFCFFFLSFFLSFFTRFLRASLSRESRDEQCGSQLPGVNWPESLSLYILYKHRVDSKGAYIYKFRGT